MNYGDEFHHLRVEIDPTDYRLTVAQRQKMDSNLETLRKLVKDFPVSEMKVEIVSESNGGVHVGTRLFLAGRTLFTGDQDRQLHPAWERCIHKLMHKVRALKDKLGNKPTYAKEIQGTDHVVHPTMEPDAKAVEHAVDELDYPAFRREVAAYDDAIGKRVGHWVNRYPDVESTLGEQFRISEIVEEVFLNAFEQYHGRPPLALGQWLESLIAQSIKQLMKRPAEEMENLRFIESAAEAGQ